MKITRRTYVIIGALILVTALFFVFRDGEEERSFVEIERDALTQEVFETGEVKKGEEIVMGFSEGGKIETVFVSEGDLLSKGDRLASLDKESVEISLKEARAALSSAEASLERLLRGATKEEISSAEARVDSAESNFETAKESLENTQKNVKEILDEAHGNTPHTLSEAHFRVEEVKDGIDSITNRHFTGIYISETYSARRSRDAIRRSEETIGNYKQMIVEEEVSFKDKDEALEVVESEMRKIVSEIDNIIEIAEGDFYEKRMKDTLTGDPGEFSEYEGFDSPRNDIDLLKLFRREMNSNLSTITSLKRAVSSARAETDGMLSSARGEKRAAESALEEAKRSLDQVTADASPEEVRQNEAAVDQARAKVSLLEKRLRDSTLTAPGEGVVSNLFKRSGEIAGAGEPVAEFTLDDEFQIEVFIYEGDIPGVDVGDTANVSFVAFPDEEFKGEVVSINPVGEIKDGVVHYKTVIILDDYPENVRANMTVDATILAKEKEDVLIVPREATYVEDGKDYVDVLVDGKRERREVELGMMGEGRSIEVISGLSEGEKVILE